MTASPASGRRATVLVALLLAVLGLATLGQVMVSLDHARRAEAAVLAVAAEAAAAELQGILDRRERSARWLLVLASLGLAAGLAALAWMQARLEREQARRLEAECEAESSHHELNDSVEALTRVSRNMQRLSAYASLLQSCQRSDEALDITKISLSSLLPDCAGTVYLLGEVVGDDENVGVAHAAVSWGEHALPSRLQVSTLDCWGMRRVQPFASDGRSADLRCAHIEATAARGDVASLCIPLNAQGESLGLLYLSGTDPLPEPALAETAAEQLSMALANLRLKETLHNQSIRDALTGLYNRRHLEDRLARELSRAIRQQRTLAVMMLDVDHFKRFNDSHGHPGGDALLAAVGKLLKATCRAEDIPCRYGGEEFTVIMPDTDAEAAMTQAERIRVAVEALQVRHEGQPLSTVTASIGVAVYPRHAELQETLLELADAALYRAKQAGRNRVLVAEPALGSG